MRRDRDICAPLAEYTAGMSTFTRTIWILAGFAACHGAKTSAPETMPEAAATEHLGLGEIALDAAPMPDLGTHTRTITTTSDAAQAFFDQGLRLLYGFNHDEAARSFAKAAELDPACASCFWGVALVLGPNYNMPMLANRFPAAWTALREAQELAVHTTPEEQALIAALAKRYPGPEALDREAMAPWNQAYADAMKEVAARFPSDDDVQVLYAESLMDLTPWRLWSSDGEAGPNTDEIVSVLETVLARSPTHPGANHYYIHAIEASPHPEKGVPSADRLAALMPGAGHIVHMPAHIYQRVGRYADASAANLAAIATDERYIDRAPSWGYYPMYFVHNHGFLAYSDSMLGRSESSLRAARAAAANFPPRMLEMMPGMDYFVSEPLLVMVRFGKWDEILAEPRPDPAYQTLTGLWLHAHGMASSATGDIPQATADLAELRQLRDNIPPDVVATNNSARDIVTLATAVLEADLAQTADDPGALDLWAAAVALEDRMTYAEPADWFYPVRHYQGAALLDAKRYAEAEAVYLADLERHPENGWALFGLTKALEGQGKAQEAAKALARFERAWPDADVEISTTASW